MNKKETTMQRAQSVIKYIFIINVLVFCQTVNAQEKLLGAFCIDYKLKYFSKCITFKPENEFEYKLSGDLGLIEYGKGIYEIDKKYLILNFNRSRPKALSFHQSYFWKSKYSWKKTNDSIVLDFKIVNLKKESMPYSSILLYFSDGKRQVKRTDKNGVLRFPIKKSGKDVLISIGSMGLRWYKFKLTPNSNYHVDFFLNEDSGTPILNQTDTLKIVDIRKDSFKVKGKNGKIFVWKKYKP